MATSFSNDDLFWRLDGEFELHVAPPHAQLQLVNSFRAISSHHVPIFIRSFFAVLLIS